VKTPFTILTGWLGAGKTTALNRLLAAPHGKRIAVLVNELGRISIDTQLIVSRGGDVLELAGGCVCCKVDTKNDLWDGIGDVIARSAPDQVVLETTGIAEPAAILAGMARVPEAQRDRVLPAGIVCVVDAEAGAAPFARHAEARAQLAAADRVLLAKLDVATAAAVRATHAALDELAPAAERASFAGDQAGAIAMTAWVCERRAIRGAGAAHAHHDHAHGAHHHPGQLVAAMFSDPAPLVGERVLAVLTGLGDQLVRAKGFVHVAGDPRRAFIEKAGIRTELRWAGEWGGESPRTDLVMIGDDLDDAALQRALHACRAGG
jgi:G3E family GTPase